VPHINLWEPCCFAKVPDGPQTFSLNVLWLQEPRYVCLSEARDSHSQRIWAEVSSSVPHLLHSGMSSSPSRWRCLLRVLSPVRKHTRAHWCICPIFLEFKHSIAVEIGLFALTIINKQPFSLPRYCGINTWEGTISTVRRKCKWLFIIGCAHKSFDVDCDGTFKVMQKWNKCIIGFGGNVGK